MDSAFGRNMQKTLGAFIPRESVDSKQEFFLRAWTLLEAGPAVVRPRRCGSYEPLCLVQDVDLKSVLRNAYFTSNGRSCLCSVWPPAFHDSRYFTVTILLRKKPSVLNAAHDIYRWLKDGFSADITYMGTPTQLMFNENISLHQILNSGACERDIASLRELRTKLDCFDELRAKKEN